MIEENKTPDLCALCSARFIASEHATGYATRADSTRICYNCAALAERDAMIADGRACLYLDENKKTVTNWTGLISIPLLNGLIKKSKHNFGFRSYRLDFWFIFDGYIWHGANIGTDNMIARCKRTRTAWVKLAGDQGYGPKLIKKTKNKG